MRMERKKWAFMNGSFDKLLQFIASIKEEKL